MAEYSEETFLAEVEKRVQERLRITQDTDALEKHIGNLQHELRDKRNYQEDGKTPNPFSEKFFNVTEQGRLWVQDRVRAERLAARAGTTIGQRPKKERS